MDVPFDGLLKWPHSGDWEKREVSGEVLAGSWMGMSEVFGGRLADGS